MRGMIDKQDELKWETRQEAPAMIRHPCLPITQHAPFLS